MLLKKFFNVGFEDVVVTDRRRFGLGDLTKYPLFAPDFIEFMRRVMPPERHGELVFSIAVTARKPLADHPRRGLIEAGRPGPSTQRRTR